MRRLAVLALLAAAAPAAPSAWAQPTTRYPKPPVDPDRAREQRSTLWEAATHPAKAPYAAALDEARRKMDQRTTDSYVAAVHLLDHAIALLPDAPEAYDQRGHARLALRAWDVCADDLAAALAHAHDPKLLAKDLRRDLGVCQARAGRLADAEATLADAAALSTHDGLVWMRLGEVRVAMGKLDEAIAAFDTAQSEGNASAAVLWLRAGAYDRARQPSKAEEDVRAAMINDRSKSQIDSGELPLLGAGEREFLFGVACQYAEPTPASPGAGVESALLYFRRFLVLAPGSPWRRRVEEHVRELSAIPLPETVARVSGNAPLDVDAATKIVRAGMPKMRACLAKTPSAMIEIRITRTGPHVPAASPDHPRYRAPPAGVQSTSQLDFDTHPGELEAAIRCLEPLADKLALPAIKDKETYYQVVFSVVAP